MSPFEPYNDLFSKRLFRNKVNLKKSIQIVYRTHAAYTTPQFIYPAVLKIGVSYLQQLPSKLYCVSHNYLFFYESILKALIINQITSFLIDYKLF